MYPSVAKELDNNFEVLPLGLYMYYWRQMINIMSGYRQGEFSLYSHNDKHLKYKLELEHEMKMGRIKKHKIDFNAPLSPKTMFKR